MENLSVDFAMNTDILGTKILLAPQGAFLGSWWTPKVVVHTSTEDRTNRSAAKGCIYT